MTKTDRQQTTDIATAGRRRRGTPGPPAQRRLTDRRDHASIQRRPRAQGVSSETRDPRPHGDVWLNAPPDRMPRKSLLGARLGLTRAPPLRDQSADGVVRREWCAGSGHRQRCVRTSATFMRVLWLPDVETSGGGAGGGGRGSEPGRSSSPLRGLEVLRVAAGGPLAGRGRRRVRATFPAARAFADHDRSRCGRTDREPARRAGRQGS